jgi:pSer/pThr/pTyr-binding forkhead associated (FHA) protein
MKKSENETTVLSQRGKVKGAGELVGRGLLVVLSENFFGDAFVIEKPEIVLGRHPSCDIVVGDPLVSKEHLRISAEGERIFFVEDLGSKNGTFVNKKKVRKKTRLLYGDRLVTGNTIFRFFLEEKISKK